MLIAVMLITKGTIELNMLSILDCKTLYVL